MKVINLYAGPGSGKSTTAAGLFYLMKIKGMNVELVTEFAKQLVWQERHATFEDQLYIFAKQNHKIFSLRGKVDYVVTDSPLLLSLIYMPDKYLDGFNQLVWSAYNSYDNINFYIKRVKKYNPVGRNQNETQAKEIDSKIINYIGGSKIPIVGVNGDKNAPQEILKNLLTVN